MKNMLRLPTSPWLYPEEQSEVIWHLLNYGLIKVDNNRNLPLKSGGKTDIYLNLRDARNDPRAIEYLTRLFAIPLRRLDGLDRFIEVPDSVSCFAGPLAIATGLPYLTVREQPKAGRVADAKVIGQAAGGDCTVLIDDVITDGASKIVPHRECRRLGLDNCGLIVLVDRQQGWKAKLDEAGAEDLHVWPGMTLHDVRRHLIQTLGVIGRCDPEVATANKLIIALDGKGWDSLLALADQLRTAGCILKVNDLLFDLGIEWLLPNLAVYGRVMADLKCHDIPNTVANTCRRLANCGAPPWAVTVHASGGPEMVKAAKKSLEGTPTKVLAVTVLTSIDPATCEEIYHRRPLDQVLSLAAAAWTAGADGFVCSPEEVSQVKQAFQGALAVTPGIRSADAAGAADDQKRIATPEAAIANGADYLVMGRDILGAADPAAAAREIMSRIKAVARQ